jgi:hypothetical protein
MATTRPFLRRKKPSPDSVETVTAEVERMSLTPTRKRLALTIGEEIDFALQDWYAPKPVPEAEQGNGAAYDKELRKEYDKDLSEDLYRFCYGKKNPAPPPKPAVELSTAGVRPEFGTPEFWAWARRRKLEKEKEAAVKAAEKEAAVAAKAAAKAAEAAAKEAAKAEKAAKKIGSKSWKAAN